MSNVLKQRPEIKGSELQTKLKSLVGVASFTSHRLPVFLKSARALNKTTKENTKSTSQSTASKSKTSTKANNQANAEKRRQMILMQIFVVLGIIFGIQKYMSYREREVARTKVAALLQNNPQLSDALKKLKENSEKENSDKEKSAGNPAP